jgi:hypothetical protein
LLPGTQPGDAKRKIWVMLRLGEIQSPHSVGTPPIYHLATTTSRFGWLRFTYISCTFSESIPFERIAKGFLFESKLSEQKKKSWSDFVTWGYFSEKSSAGQPLS